MKNTMSKVNKSQELNNIDQCKLYILVFYYNIKFNFLVI